jgi:hypothetical protein
VVVKVPANVCATGQSTISEEADAGEVAGGLKAVYRAHALRSVRSPTGVRELHGRLACRR